MRKEDEIVLGQLGVGSVGLQAIPFRLPGTIGLAMRAVHDQTPSKQYGDKDG
jgi:hypothetical protein